MSWDSLYQKLATALPVGEGPDIIAYNTEYIASYAESGALAVINDLYETGGMDAKAIPAAMEENLKYNGEYYGVPCNMATLLLYYNKDLFAAAGLDPEAPPTTWDELESAALALTKEVDGEQQYGFGMATNNTIQMWPIMSGLAAATLSARTESPCSTARKMSTRSPAGRSLSRKTVLLRGYDWR